MWLIIYIKAYLSVWICWFTAHVKAYFIIVHFLVQYIMKIFHNTFLFMMKSCYPPTYPPCQRTVTCYWISITAYLISFVVNLCICQPSHPSATWGHGILWYQEVYLIWLTGHDILTQLLEASEFSHIPYHCLDLETF